MFRRAGPLLGLPIWLRGMAGYRGMLIVYSAYANWLGDPARGGLGSGRTAHRDRRPQSPGPLSERRRFLCPFCATDHVVIVIIT